MALTYSTLQTTIADTLNRDDLASSIPTFILLAEAAMNRKVRHWKMEKRSEATFNQRYEPLPPDWLKTVRVSVGGQTQLDLLSQAKMLDYRDNHGNLSGEPRYYAISAGQIEFFPTPDGDYDGSMIYYEAIPALSDTNTSNWLLAEAPDVYLYGSLLHSAPYLQEDSRLAVWQTLYASAMNDLNGASDEGLYSGSGLTIR